MRLFSLLSIAWHGFTAILILAVGLGFAQSSDIKEVKDWLNNQAVPIKSLEAGNGFQDLMHLKTILKDAHIVGLGESTHGTREFFLFKHRLLEFLVKEMGFTVLAVESSYSGCIGINDYVLYGKGTRATALAGQKFWTFYTQEIANMIDWLYTYNQKVAANQKVKFYGIDFQFPDVAIGHLGAYIQKVAPDYLETAIKATEPVRILPTQIRYLWEKSEEEKAKNRANFQNLLDQFTDNKTKFIQRSTAAEYASIVQQIRILFQFYRAYSAGIINRANPDQSGSALRDRFLFENLEYIIQQEGPESKIVVWAHNGHISNHSYMNIPSMGSHLQKKYEKGYYALGFCFSQGSFQSISFNRETWKRGPLTEFHLGPAPEGSVGWYLAQVGYENYLVDFSAISPTPTITDWLNRSHPMRLIGSRFSYSIADSEVMIPIVLRNHFDGLVFIRTTSRARPIRKK